MAEIGSGSIDYPTGIDTNDTPESVSTTVRANVPNDLANAIVAIEGELGISPSQDKSTVLEFLQVEHNSAGTHKATKIVNVEDTQTISGAKTFSGNMTVTGTFTLTGAFSFASDSWPSFSAYLSGNQGSITGTDQVEFNTENFDTNSDYNVSTWEFIPTVAGKYLLTASVQWSSTLNDQDQLILQIHKNGVAIKESKILSQTTIETQSITTIVDANGSDDDFRVYAQNVNRDTSTILGGVTKSWFEGSRIG